MRTLILGAGATGGYFGGRMAAAGQDVTFLVRPKRAELLAQTGLTIISPLGDARLSPTVITAAQSAYDLIILSCKAYDLDAAILSIAPAVGDATLILPLLNGLRHMDALDARFGAEHVIGGLCHIGVTLTETGAVHHLNAMQRFIMGARSDAQTARVRTAYASVAAGGFSPQLSPDITLEMWEKFVLLASYAGMTCLMRASVGAIMQATEGQALMTELLTECAQTATAAGHPSRPDVLTETLAMLTDKASSGTSSMLRDIRNGARTEHDHILGDMLARSRQAGVNAPILRAAYAHLQAYATQHFN